MTFEELRKLEDDWDGLGALKPTTKSIDQAEVLCRVVKHFGFAVPEVCPTTNGTVSLEWYDGKGYLEIEIERNGVPHVYASLTESIRNF